MKNISKIFDTINLAERNEFSLVQCYNFTTMEKNTNT